MRPAPPIDAVGPVVWAWRHPAARAGRCIGRTDVRVDPRRAKRLARRIQAAARRHGLPRVVHTSPLARCTDVGRWLRRWGWHHVVDDELLELAFGAWDGRRWQDIDRAQIDAWCADFAATPPGGGEPLRALLHRAAAWRPRVPCGRACVVVAHAGRMQARRWMDERSAEPPLAQTWPSTPAHGDRWLLPAPPESGP